MRRQIAIVSIVLIFLAGGFAITVAQEQDPQKKFQSHILNGNKAYQKKDFEAAIEEYKAAVEIYPDANATYNLACCYAMKGDKDRALDWLSRAVERGFDDTAHLAKDVDLESLRDDARYKNLVKLMEGRKRE